MSLRKNAKIQLLRWVPLFSGCSSKELGQIATIADEISVPPEDELIREGDRGREFFALIEGSADVKRKGRMLSTFGPGDFFGEIAIVAETPRTATVTTTAPSRLLIIVDRDFDRLLAETPSLPLKVLRELAHRLAPLAI
jgi:CRP-like cAMP-binding protein